MASLVLHSIAFCCRGLGLVKSQGSVMKNLRQILHAELLQSKVIPCNYVQDILKVTCISFEDMSFKEFLTYASETVSRWPVWKQNLLGTPNWGQEANKALSGDSI